MARIRTMKPEYWDDEIVGSLTWGSRLVFPGSWNFADDEGLIRWSPDFLKASVFKYDTKVTLDDVAEMMRELEDAGFVYVYSSSRARHRIGFIVNFRKHQRIDKPQAAKLPVPNWRDPAVVMLYARRDGFVCRHCRDAVNEEFAADLAGRRYDPVCERIKSPAERPSGPDDPSNIAVVHVMCAKDYDPSSVPPPPIPRTFQERSENDPGTFQEWSSEDRAPRQEAVGPAREAHDAAPPSAEIPVAAVIPGTFPEQSAREGKGREGIRKGKEEPPSADGTLFGIDESARQTRADKPRGGGRKPKKVRTPEEQARFETATNLAEAWYENLAIKPSGDKSKVFLGVRGVIDDLLAVGNASDAIAEAARRCDRMISRNAMEFQLVVLDREAGRSVVPFQRRGHEPYRNDPDMDRSAGFPGATVYEGA